jgi:F-type H+-transporting ATPase subunit b
MIATLFAASCVLASYFLAMFAEVSLLSKFVNLALFAGAIGFLIGKYALPALDQNRKTIQQELRKAKEAKTLAEEKLMVIEGRLSRLNDEVVELRAAAEREARAEYERIAKQTEEDIARLRATAQREIEAARRAAELQLREYAANKAVELAETIIRKEINPADEARLVKLYAREMEGVK